MFKKVLQSGLLTILLLAMIGALGFSIYRVYQSGRPVNLDAENLKKKIVEIKNQTAELARQNKNADNQAFLERQIKQKLNYKKADENVVFIYKNPYNQKPEQTVEMQTDQPMPITLTIWGKFMNWLKNL